MSVSRRGFLQGLGVDRTHAAAFMAAAYARAGEFQGNIKMKKFDLFGRRDLHPDAKFVKLNKNNVAEEKDMLTNFKLWWARLFRKNDTQTDHLKDKGHRPRYDKGEAGLWYD